MIEVELLQLYMEVNQDIDTQFQFWISITFAVLVATFVAGHRLSRGGRAVIAALYLCGAALLLSRYFSALSHLGIVLGLYEQYGVEPPSVIGTAGLLRITIFLVGSLVTVLSVLLPHLGFRLEPSSAPAKPESLPPSG